MRAPTPPGFRKHASVYTVFSMVLLLVFSIATLMLSFTATRAFWEIQQDKTNISELVVALSYLNMKVRQNDSQGAITVRPSPSGNGQALVITEVLDSTRYETWVYWYDGELREAFILEGNIPQKDTSSLIAEIDGFDVYGKSNQIKIRVWCQGQGKTRDLTFKLSQRTTQEPADQD